MIKTHENKKQEKIKINFVVNRRYSIFNMFTESNYFVNFCLNVPPPPSTVSIFCECAEHKNSEFYSFYINVQWWCVSKWNIMHFTLLLSEHFCPHPQQLVLIFCFRPWPCYGTPVLITYILLLNWSVVSLWIL